MLKTPTAAALNTMNIPPYIVAPLLIVVAVIFGDWIRQTFFPWWDGRR